MGVRQELPTPSVLQLRQADTPRRHNGVCHSSTEDEEGRRGIETLEISLLEESLLLVELGPLAAIAS